MFILVQVFWYCALPRSPTTSTEYRSGERGKLSLGEHARFRPFSCIYSTNCSVVMMEVDSSNRCVDSHASSTRTDLRGTVFLSSALGFFILDSWEYQPQNGENPQQREHNRLQHPHAPSVRNRANHKRSNGTSRPTNGD